MEVATASTANATSVKVQDEAESEAPTRIQPPKPLSLTNGVLKRLHPPHHHHHHHHLNGQPVVVTYKECLKNHAATMGGHAVDGCGEFMPSPTANPADPTSLKCAACGCHRNFHRREPDEPLPASPTAAQHVIEYQSHHRHHPPPPLPAPPRSPNSASPPPISSSYYPSAPHMLLALSSGGLSGLPHENNPSITPTSGATTGSGGNLNPSSRKRFRTKFTQNQKDKMYEFAEKLCWKMQKRDEDLINEFCNEVGVDKGVFKVWMHNNKNTLGKKDLHNSNGISRSISLDNTPNHYNSTEQNLTHHHHQNDSVSAHPVATNGSSSSS